MSEQKLEPKEDGPDEDEDVKAWLTNSLTADKGIHLPTKLVTSDKDNPTKTRIPENGVMGMTVLKMIGSWESFSTFEDMMLGFTVAKDGQMMPRGFAPVYEQTAISKGGKSREEFVTVGVAALLEQKLDQLSLTAQKRLVEEGTRK